MSSTAGLDAPTRKLVISLLEHLHTSPTPPHIVLGMRLQDPLPEWTTHVALVHTDGTVETGRKQEVLSSNAFLFGHHLNTPTNHSSHKKLDEQNDVEALVELNDVSVTYGDRKVSH